MQIASMILSLPHSRNVRTELTTEYNAYGGLPEHCWLTHFVGWKDTCTHGHTQVRVWRLGAHWSSTHDTVYMAGPIYMLGAPSYHLH